MESNILSRVTRDEFIKGGWYAKSEEERYELAPNLYILINHANHITNWISTEIVKHVTKESRAETIMKFITICKVTIILYITH